MTLGKSLDFSKPPVTAMILEIEIFVPSTIQDCWKNQRTLYLRKHIQTRKIHTEIQSCNRVELGRERIGHQANWQEVKLE